MNRIEINKELLSEVLDINDIVHVQKEGNNSIFISRANNPAYIISVYEFAFKCKEWAYSTYGIMIQSYPYCGKSRADALKGLEVDEVFKENTEVEAIIQACEWILKEINENR